MELPDDVVRYIERSFSAIDRAEALEALRGAVFADASQSPARLIRCAAVSARRDLGRLRKQVAQLRIDWRDVIVEGEYVVRDGKLVRAHDFLQPIPDSAN
jgi:hypothetical protein